MLAWGSSVAALDAADVAIVIKDRKVDNERLMALKVSIGRLRLRGLRCLRGFLFLPIS